MLANAKSLAQVIEAQALVARDELAALNAEIGRVGKDLEAVGSDIAAIEAQARDRRGIRDRLTRDAFRLAAATSTPSLAALSDAQIEAYRELLSIDASLREAHARLSERAAQLAGAQAAVAAKQGQLSRLRDRARTIAAAAAKGEGEKRAAEVAVLEALSRDAAAAQTVLAQLVANAMAGDGAAPSAWVLPVRGTITQAFGPTTFALEPPRFYQGVQYAHSMTPSTSAQHAWHAGRGSAESGRVTFVDTYTTRDGRRTPLRRDRSRVGCRTTRQTSRGRPSRRSTRKATQVGRVSWARTRASGPARICHSRCSAAEGETIAPLSLLAPPR